MLMVAPSGKTKLETSLETPSFLEHSIFTGSVPTEEAEANANTIADIWSLKKRTGLTLARIFTSPEYTITI